MSPDKLLVIGLDAVEAPLLEELMDAGRMPVLSGLAARSVATDIEASCMSLLPGAIWTDLLTGRHVGLHGRFYPIALHTGEPTARMIDPAALCGRQYFDHAALAGHDVVVIDQPLVPVYDAPASLTLVSEWSVHDATYGRGTLPGALLGELEARFGVRPYDRCDDNHPDNDEGRLKCAEALKDELDVKIDMAEYLMATRPWDLFTIGITSGHCAGHQFWELHERARERGTGPDPLVDVYTAIDEAMGRLIARAGPDTGVVVFTSHGMGPYIGGPKLLPGLLSAWGYGSSRPRVDTIRRRLPTKPAEWLLRHAPERVRALGMTLANRARLFESTLDEHTQIICLENNRVGALRLNLAGREPDGVIEPDDVDRILDELERRLRAVTTPAGEPVVADVVRVAERYGSERHPDLPDVVVSFRRDLGELVDIVCPEAGTFHVPIRTPYYRRTGDHTDRSRIWLDHPAVESIGPMCSEDLAPTLLALLDIEVPSDMTGTAAVRLHEGERA